MRKGGRPHKRLTLEMGRLQKRLIDKGERERKRGRPHKRLTVEMGRLQKRLIFMGERERKRRRPHKRVESEWVSTTHSVFSKFLQNGDCMTVRFL